MVVLTLAITGPGGVGKTTVAFEVSRRLEASEIGHALIDVGELDGLFPAPPDDPHKSEFTGRNLAAVWGNFRAAGASRLILVGVMVSLDRELPHVKAAGSDAAITVIRLRATEEALPERVRRSSGRGPLRYT